MLGLEACTHCNLQLVYVVLGMEPELPGRCAVSVLLPGLYPQPSTALFKSGDLRAHDCKERPQVWEVEI